MSNDKEGGAHRPRPHIVLSKAVVGVGALLSFLIFFMSVLALALPLFEQRCKNLPNAQFYSHLIEYNTLSVSYHDSRVQISWPTIYNDRSIFNANLGLTIVVFLLSLFATVLFGYQSYSATGEKAGDVKSGHLMIVVGLVALTFFYGAASRVVDSASYDERHGGAEICYDRFLNGGGRRHDRGALVCQFMGACLGIPLFLLPLRAFSKQEYY